MNVRHQSVVVLLSDEGQSALQLAVPSLPETRLAPFYVQDTDDIGMWVRVKRPDGEHLLLVRWEFVLTIDMAVGETKTVGWKP